MIDSTEEKEEAVDNDPSSTVEPFSNYDPQVFVAEEKPDALLWLFLRCQVSITAVWPSRRQPHQHLSLWVWEVDVMWVRAEDDYGNINVVENTRWAKMEILSIQDLTYVFASLDTIENHSGKQ